MDTENFYDLLRELQDHQSQTAVWDNMVYEMRKHFRNTSASAAISSASVFLATLHPIDILFLVEMLDKYQSHNQYFHERVARVLAGGHFLFINGGGELTFIEHCKFRVHVLPFLVKISFPDSMVSKFRPLSKIIRKWNARAISQDNEEPRTIWMYFDTEEQAMLAKCGI